jgi:YHS domain-containing protein
MFKFVLYLFLFIFGISLIRGVMGIIGRAFFDAMRASGGPDPAVSAAQAPLNGELRKDPVCGTFISTATSLQTVSGGNTFYFCSPECRSRFKAVS